MIKGGAMNYRKRWMTVVLSMFFIVAVVAGCTSTGDTYKAESRDEEKIRSVFSKYAHEWNNKNEGPYLSIWHPDAEITYGQSKTKMPKKLYSTVALNGMSSLTEIQFRDEIIKVNGDKASAEVTLTGTGANGNQIKQRENYQLVKENGRWFLISNQY
jgi:hypothetical protein